jgi:hypothetical protein
MTKRRSVCGQLTLTLVVDYEYWPGRAAPPSSNHDSPLFSDPGEDAEAEFRVSVSDSDAPVAVVNVLENAIERGDDAVYDALVGLCEDEIPSEPEDEGDRDE